MSFSTEELQEIEFKTEQQNGGLIYKWNSEKENTKEIDFIELEKTLIKDILSKMEMESRLSEQLIDLYELFII